jgi:hypothetical protein
MEIVAFGSFVDVRDGSSKFSVEVELLGQRAAVPISVDTYQTLAEFYQHVYAANTKMPTSEPTTATTSPTPLVQSQISSAPQTVAQVLGVTEEELQKIDEILKKRAVENNFDLSAVDESALNGMRMNLIASLRATKVEMQPVAAPSGLSALAQTPDSPVDEDGVESVAV